MRNLIIALFLIVGVNQVYATKTSSVQTGDWGTASTWDNGVPGCYDTIVISSLHTVTLTANIDLSACTSPIYLIVEGTLDLNCWTIVIWSGGYNLSLPAGSALSVDLGGQVTGCNGGGWLSNPPATIIAGTTPIYDSDTDGDVDGPNYIGEDGTELPVELLSFIAESNNHSLTLYWQTAAEQDCDYFQIERSINGFDWEILDLVYGAGNSNILLDYSYIDKNPQNGANYYRLKQVDFDGAFEFFGPIHQNYNNEIEEGSMQIYPNPNDNGRLEVQLNVHDDRGLIQIYDYSGRLLIQLHTDSNSPIFTMDISELPKGLYILKYLSNSTVLSEKLVVN